MPLGAGLVAKRLGQESEITIDGPPAAPPRAAALPATVESDQPAAVLIKLMASLTHPPAPTLLMTNDPRPIELNRVSRRFRGTVGMVIRGGVFGQPLLGLTRRLSTPLGSLQLLGQLVSTSIPIQLVLLT